jgi:hypothetical protein
MIAFPLCHVEQVTHSFPFAKPNGEDDEDEADSAQYEFGFGFGYGCRRKIII